jgi:hypothetical protein
MASAISFTWASKRPRVFGFVSMSAAVLGPSSERN